MGIVGRTVLTWEMLSTLRVMDSILQLRKWIHVFIRMYAYGDFYCADKGGRGSRGNGIDLH